jgi:hypothetical protein
VRRQYLREQDRHDQFMTLSLKGLVAPTALVLATITAFGRKLYYKARHDLHLMATAAKARSMNPDGGSK